MVAILSDAFAKVIIAICADVVWRKACIIRIITRDLMANDVTVGPKIKKATRHSLLVPNAKVKIAKHVRKYWTQIRKVNWKGSWPKEKEMQPEVVCLVGLIKDLEKSDSDYMSCMLYKCGIGIVSYIHVKCCNM